MHFYKKCAIICGNSDGRGGVIMTENNERTFDLGSVLTVTTRRLFTDMDSLYDILNYLSNDIIFTHQIPRVLKAAQPYVLARYPQLIGVGQDVVIDGLEDAKAFLDSQKAVLGDSFALSPMPREMCEHIDPIEEAIEIRLGKTR